MTKKRIKDEFSSTIETRLAADILVIQSHLAANPGKFRIVAFDPVSNEFYKVEEVDDLPTALRKAKEFYEELRGTQEFGDKTIFGVYDDKAKYQGSYV